ncbi:hypothetical protein MIMGU_mgv1a020292mg, partial [Erythranthe guttata]
GKLFHVKCACHIFNLGVHDCLKVLSPSISKVRNSVCYIRQSGQRMYLFKELCKAYGVKFKRPINDDDIRWNSTYLMLGRALELKDPVIEFYKAQKITTICIEDDWAIAARIKDMLEPWYKATLNCSGTLYPTSNMLPIELWQLSQSIANYRKDKAFGLEVVEMEDKYIKYYEDIPLLSLLAIVMDPRVKLRKLQTLLKGYYTHMCSELSPSKVAGTAMRKYEEVEKLLYSLYEEYKKVFGTNISISSSSQSSSKKNRKSTWSLLEEDDVRSSGTNELVRYLEFRSYHNTPEEYESLDILKWWQENAHHYPVVSMMARDLLNTPVSTVASEAAFSAGGKILTAERNRLSPRNVEALVCTQDWIEAELRNQERSQQQNNQGKDDDSPDEYDIRGEFSGEGY